MPLGMIDRDLDGTAPGWRREETMRIEVGKTYIQTDPGAYPEALRGATVVVTAIDAGAAPDQLAVAYSYRDGQGHTGQGTMQLSYAQEFLRPIELEDTGERAAMKKKAMFVVKRRSVPMLAAVVAYHEGSGRIGKVLASEPIKSDFSNADLIAVARRLVPQVPDYDVVLPVGVDL